ncbi:MAG: hypothetical protein FWH20_01520 [Oscillospiraceae bacterium]|nr:hypothetical protein [Oscillospiraceae bacterium]
MKTGLTEIIFLYDSNPPMPNFDKQARKNFSDFFSGLKKTDAEIKVTFITYGGDGCRIIEDDTPVAAVRMSAKYFETAGGRRDFFDAAASAIVKKGENYSATDEAEHPENVVFVLTAFGRDNASKNFTYSQVAEMVGHQTYVYKWKFFCLTTDMTVSGQLDIPGDSVIILGSDGEGEDFLSKGLKVLGEKVVQGIINNE